MESQVRYKEKSVIIHRDENGFGLRVGGQNPVFVDCVHENGAAWKAGVRKDDLIIKVNGTLVKALDHQRVVGLIQQCTPFVNLTLHYPDTNFISEPIESCRGLVQSSSFLEQQQLSTTGMLMGNSNVNNSSPVSNNIKNSPFQRLHHSSVQNLNWLSNIGDDLFQDDQQLRLNNNAQQPQPIEVSSLDTHSSSAPQSVGMSRLVVSGPSPVVLNHSQQAPSGGKSKIRSNRNQSITGENPYYYYRPDLEQTQDISTCNSASSSFLIQDPTSSKSIVRSRSSGKITSRSTTGKYKRGKLRSRIVEDLRSLKLAASQATPSSLSTSPSSSDLSDCDDTDPCRIDCISLNTSPSSTNVSLMASNTNSSGMPMNQQASVASKSTIRRLEIIRELIDTEKTHVEKLKQLNDLLYKPIKAEGLVPVEQLKMVFSCHKTLFKIHKQIYKLLSAAQQSTSECYQEPFIGKALVEIFEGELGKRLEKAASTFCACQSSNTDLLNRFTRKDTKAGEFLAQVANQQMLGRLGIKDLLASCFQRLTKYPLLLDNLLKATPVGTNSIHLKSLSEGSIATSLTASIANSTTTDELTLEDVNSHELPCDQLNQTLPATIQTDIVTDPSKNNDTVLEAPLNIINNNNNNNINHNEVESTSNSATSSLDERYTYERVCITRALNQTRQILVHVNEAVDKANAYNKLREIWKRTDKNPNIPVIDIETQEMLHDGPLTLRLFKRTFDVHVLLLTEYIVILTKEGQDKYKLKHFIVDGKTTTVDGKPANQFSPIFKIDEHLATRDTATDENGFYLLCKRKDDSRIYEFASPSPADRAKWKEKIHKAQFYNYAVVPEDDNTLTRYRELISLVGQQ